MRDILGIFLEIIVALAGAVAFGSVVIALGVAGAGCLVWGGWRRRRAERLGERR